jgi:hypothetical protein
MQNELNKEYFISRGWKYKKQIGCTLNFTVNENDLSKYLSLYYDSRTNILTIWSDRSTYRDRATVIGAVKINTIDEYEWLMSRLLFWGQSINNILQIL